MHQESRDSPYYEQLVKDKLLPAENNDTIQYILFKQYDDFVDGNYIISSLIICDDY